MPYHDVQPGETLLGLAAANGLESWKDILDRPENAELKKKRTDPGILKAGDRVFIPNKEMGHEPAAVDAKHTFKIGPPKAWLRLAVKDADGQACAGKKYELSVAGKTASGNLPAGGLIKQAVPIDTTAGTLTVWIAPYSQVWSLKIGHMDPPDELSGVQARLNNLGFDCGEPDGAETEDTQNAIRAFQVRLGLEATGAVDDALRQKILSFYDPDQDETAQQVEPEIAEEAEEESEATAGAGDEAQQEDAEEEDDPVPTPLTAHVQLCETQDKGGDKLRTRSWIKVKLVGEDSAPIPNQNYEIKLPGGKLLTGTLNEKGSVRLDGIPPGACEVSFPDLDKDAWVRMKSQAQSGQPAAEETKAA
ncbi:MAG TPA: peptidoglycan-binding domain-containing protein [Thermoanaerobaculia bacterium]